MASDAQMLEGVGDYKYGFHDTEDYVFKSRKGLDRRVVENISAMKGEPKWMLDFRLKAFEHFQKRPMPVWGADLSGLDLDNIYFYVKPTEGSEKSWEDVPDTIKNTFDKLGIPEAERKFLAGVGAQYECLSGDTRVYTQRGVLPIREVSRGDIVFSLDEGSDEIKPAPVKGMMPKGTRPVFQVKAGTHKLRATANHPFLVLEHQKEAGRQRGRDKRSWKYLSDIKVGDLIAIAKALPDVGQPHQLEMPSVDIKWRHNPVELPADTSSDLMWWLGLYIGDGFIHREKQKARVEFAIPETENSLRKELASVTNKLFDIDTQDSDSYRMTIGSTVIARYLMANGFSGGSLEKRVPDWVASLPREQVLAFLGGYIDSDGCVHDRKDSHDAFLTSGNEALMEDIRDLASLCGLPTSNIHRFQSDHPYDKTRKIVGYRMSFAGDYERLGCRSEQRLERFGKRKFWHDYSSAENTSFRKYVNEWFGYIRVDSIEAAGFEPVFDIEVDGPHNFVAEGLIVHNSEMVYHSIQEHLEKLGVIFLSIEDGLRQHPDLFREYFGTVIPIEDNKLAALNSAVWSGGSFVYVPKGVKVDLPLQAYFRLNTANMGQFERSLIIVDEGADLHYVEGCFLEGARVRTRSGEKPIEQISIGDEVMTHQGRWRKVYHLSRRPYHGPIFNIRYYGDSQRELKVTAEHPLLVVRRERNSERNRDFQLTWTRADQVRIGDYLAVPVPQPVLEPVPVYQRTAMIGHGRHSYEERNVDFPNGPELLAELVKGMWRGDGSYDARKNMFLYTTIIETLAYEFRDALLQLGIAASVNKQTRPSSSKDTYTVVIASPCNSQFGNLVEVDAPVGNLSGLPLALDANFQYMPIKKITQEEDETEVFNFSVEEDESYVAEGVVSHNCTAPQYTTDSFHSGVIEIVVKKGARSRYTTIQNWSTNVYNLVTQRAMVYQDATHEWTDANLGSKVTMKYPSCYLMEPGAHGGMLSMAFAGPGQHQDAGSKMVHFAPNTTSKVTSKSISKGGGRSSYRGLVKIYKGATGARSNASCDALLLDPQSRSDTYPTIEIDENDVTVGHEASVSKIGEEQLFYLMSRGLSQENATTMVVSGFIEPLVKELPMEYAVEMNRLIQLQMSGSVG